MYELVLLSHNVGIPGMDVRFLGLQTSTFTH